jgi:hypothetical protein
MTGPAQQQGFTPEGYKRPPVRVTLTGFSLAPSLRRISLFLLRCYTAGPQRSPPVAGLGVAVRGHACRHTLGSDFASLFFFFFLSIWCGLQPEVRLWRQHRLASVAQTFLCFTSARSHGCLVLLFCFLFSCRLGTNPNPSTPVFFHRACTGG